MISMINNMKNKKLGLIICFALWLVFTAGGSFAVDHSLPTTPVLSSAVAKDQRTVSLSWQVSKVNDVVEKIVAYRVYRRLSDDEHKARLVRIVGTEKESRSRFEIDLLQKENTGLSYRYSVSAVDGDGNESLMSNSIAVTLPHTIKPRNPIGLDVMENSSEGSNHLLLSWQPVTEAKNYRIYRRLEGLSKSFDLLATVNETNFVDKEIEPLKAYRYRVSAVDEFGNESKETKGKLVRTTRFHYEQGDKR